MSDIPDSRLIADAVFLVTALLLAVTLAVLYIGNTVVVAKSRYHESREKWPIFKTEMALVVIHPFLCLIVGLLWPFVAVWNGARWVCAADKSWCGVSCGEVRRRMRGRNKGAVIRGGYRGVEVEVDEPEECELMVVPVEPNEVV
ncbi:hypothetical protein B0T16DRAFT_456601 [Cercophora newfieldiana]|uniref:Uncharacterized protein n=1 Tax=Cercophora newfieldiana TaxID=92897 RepID=A0AA39YBC3_9PEZI|nr:hypothetical protein B0T16DRAFT_456601 [Cercophora newfieldiana]